MPHTVLVVDDHEAFRTSARALLASDGWLVVGEVADPRGALEAVQQLRPDLVLLDIGLGGEPSDPDGIDVAHALAATASPPRVVLVSARSALTYGSRLTDAPVLGFFPKVELSGRALLELLGRA